MPVSRVMVTWASGFVGRRLALSLAERGEAVLAPVRSTANLPQHDGIAALPCAGIDGRTDWSAALSGIERIVHLAARAHVVGLVGRSAGRIPPRQPRRHAHSRAALCLREFHQGQWRADAAGRALTPPPIRPRPKTPMACPSTRPNKGCDASAKSRVWSLSSCGRCMIGVRIPG
jgi:hypothetical protein